MTPHPDNCGTCGKPKPKRPDAEKRDPADLIMAWEALEKRAKTRSDRDQYLRDYDAAAYYVDDHWLILTRDEKAKLDRKWRTAIEKLEHRGIKIAGPGTLLSRWMHVASLVLSLGLVSITCARCKGRASALDRIGWARLLTLRWRA